MSTYIPGFVRSVEDAQREFQKVRQALERANPSVTWETLHAEPSRMVAGMEILADGTDWDPGSIGVAAKYRRNEANTAWELIEATGVAADLAAHEANVSNPHSVTKTQVGLSNVTNDAQTKASIVPNTAPASGQVLVGNAGGTAYAPVSMSGDASIASTGAVTVSKIGGMSVSLGGALTTSGAYASTFTMTGVTSITFPTSGTLATLAGAESLSNKTITSSSLDSSAVGASSASTGKFTSLETTGAVGVGVAPTAGTIIKVSKDITGAASARGINVTSTIQSDVTGVINYLSNLSTAAAAFTVTDLIHFQAATGTIGASSSVTNQYGFRAESTMTGATNNFGFRGNLTAATGAWNFFAGGTANNAYAGLSRFGATTVPVNTVDITGSLGRGTPVTKTTNFTLAATENWIICNGAGSITATLPAASSWAGREVFIQTIAAQTVVSSSSNVVPVSGGSAGTAILAATAGKWATLVSDGTNWQITQAN